MIQSARRAQAAASIGKMLTSGSRATSSCLGRVSDFSFGKDFTMPVPSDKFELIKSARVNVCLREASISDLSARRV